MAPDVEMRLSFPKKTGKTDSDSSSLNRKNIKQDNGNYQNYQREPSDVSNENYNLNNRAALPTTGTGNINPKRTLSKTVIGTIIITVLLLHSFNFSYFVNFR